jgi:hypothetical protein
MPNEDAHLLVSSGRYVYVSKFEARDAALSLRRSWLARIGMFVAAALAVMALLMLTTSAQARPCESLTTVQAKHPGQHAKYRSVDGRKCWYVGRTPAKSEFKRSESGLSDARNRGASQPQAVTVRERSAPTPQGMQGETSAKGRDFRRVGENPATYDEQINDAFLALCGGVCPQMLTFSDRWILR